VDEMTVMSAPLFAALDVEGAAALRASLVERSVVKGEVLFSEGDPGDRMYVIVDGKIKLGQTSGDGRESLLAVLGPGEMFGELSLFDPGVRTSTATGLTDAIVLGLGNDQLRPWLAGRPEVAAALLQALARRLRRTNEAMADLVFSDVPGRVAKALMDLGEKFGTILPDGLMVTHDMTQEELAQLVGASRETVNKALADFAQRGWIRELRPWHRCHGPRGGRLLAGHGHAPQEPTPGAGGSSSSALCELN
jgi:CRP-like cAMP-binding protein